MFEIHITTSALEHDEIPRFVEFCQSIEVKPIIIELDKGEVQQQPMISKIFKDISNEELHENIKILKQKFEGSNYDVKRIKIEVPLDFAKKATSAYPDYKGRYYEWHGKVRYEDFDELKKKVGRMRNVHLSNNSLKGEANLRFLTLRNSGTEKSFKNAVNIVKRVLKQDNYFLVKDVYEYCIYDSNKKVDKGWIDTPEITDIQYLHLLAFEGFLRRVSQFKDPFILKGSLLTRQYIGIKNARAAGDIDFVYGLPIDSDNDASIIFGEWVTKITESDSNDEIKFRSFKENEFWRGIDYAMNDDFPTTNTDLSCEVKKHIIESISLDISWNLPIDETPIELIYKPLEGEPFILPYTVPLSMQISWKLHQCIVSPRTKDLIDIILLIDNNEITENQVEKIAYHYTKECYKDHINPDRLIHYINGEVSTLFFTRESEIYSKWENYKPFKTEYGFDFKYGFDLRHVDKMFGNEIKYEYMSELIYTFENRLRKIGLDTKLKNRLPKH